MLKWEYFLLRIDYSAGDLRPQGLSLPDFSDRQDRKTNADISDYLNVLGEQGWELVTMNYTPGYGYGFLIFKRPKAMTPYTG
ncbi:MAG: DUF4177 domain-containing protein [Desertifilum sp. SIO1I2]|nr:DUF4177 domain-containing protein [Desertifilum sp. SIO1I2]